MDSIQNFIDLQLKDINRFLVSLYRCKIDDKRINQFFLSAGWQRLSTGYSYHPVNRVGYFLPIKKNGTVGTLFERDGHQIERGQMDCLKSSSPYLTMRSEVIQSLTKVAELLDGYAVFATLAISPPKQLDVDRTVEFINAYVPVHLREILVSHHTGLKLKNGVMTISNDVCKNTLLGIIRKHWSTYQLNLGSSLCIN